MYLSIPYENLYRAAKFCERSAKAGETPQEQAVIVTTTPDGLEVTSLARDVWAKAEEKCAITTAGQVAVNGKFFCDIIEALGLDPNDDVEVASTEDELEIVAKRGKLRRQIPLIALMDYSTRSSEVSHLEFVAPDFCDLLGFVARAAAPAANPKLSGVRIYEDGLCATDSYRFILVDMPLNITPVTVPSYTIEALPKPVSWGQGDIGITHNGQHFLMELGLNHRIVSSTIVMDYPDPHLMRNFAPSDETPWYLEVPTAELKDALEGFKPFGGSGARVTLHPDGLLTVVSPDGAAASHRLDCISCEVPEPISFALGFINEVKALMKGEDECKISFNDEAPTARPMSITKDNVLIGMMPMLTK